MRRCDHAEFRLLIFFPIKMKRWFGLILFVVVVAGVVYGAWLLIASVTSWIMSQESQVAAAMIMLAGTVIVGVAAVVYSQQRAKARDTAETHRPKKVEVYGGFIANLIRMIRSQKQGRSFEPKVHEEVENFFYDFTKDLMLWGSPTVLLRYRSFRTVDSTSGVDAILLLDDVLSAMREDVGLSNIGLFRGDLIQLLLTEPSDADAFVAKRRRK